LDIVHRLNYKLIKLNVSETGFCSSSGLRLAQPEGPTDRLSVLSPPPPFYLPEDGSRIQVFRNVVALLFYNLDDEYNPKEQFFILKINGPQKDD
jgi:hypothetical protein